MMRELVFEIGVEEIPSAPLYAAIGQMKADAERVLGEERLDFAAVDVFGSPRRLTLRVTDLAEQQEDQTLRAKGPSVKAAFDADGHPTKAAEGFARGKGVSVADLERVEDENGAYVYAVIDRPGRPTIDVLPVILGGLVSALEWPKSMRWGSGETRFTRPVRWMLALFGAQVVPVTFGDVEAGRVTYGHRFLAPGPIEVPTAAEYDLACRRGLVVYDHTERAALVREGIEAVAAEAGASAVVPEKVFAEVVNLVEWPTVGVGRFDEEFLEVPREVLETAMQSHQRYFPLEGPDGTLLPAFVVVHNGDPARTSPIVSGHERVIRARLADAAFFYKEDLARPLESYVAALGSIVFQEKLGTLAEKVSRIEALTGRLAALAGVDAGVTAEAMRAAHLCKADLSTHVVIEFPSLQGVMGRYYALAAGESDSVAAAIPEHYQPRFAGDDIPVSHAGRLVSVADKLDTICGIFSVGMAPTGSADPYALRRGALGVIAIVLGGLDITLDEAIGAALDGYEGALEFDRQSVGESVREFFTGRFEVVLRDRGHAYDTVEAVLAVASDDLSDARARCEALTAVRASSDVMDDLSVAFARAKNLSAPELGTAADPSLMGAEEAALADALADAEQRASVSLAARDYDSALGVLAGLRVPIDAFFDSVLVMDPDEELRRNRLRQLNRFVALFERFADFSRLAG
ncbi:MAG: glycine--tRNA ligase subunit beta [Anaerosomatales bacterium]|nr:glycine--tRNA ligase subunit beta [Anaerosomatales bacterium]MDT8433517.1 glycine--tRNA ligase subunit beta [Anaerosomatales bacterium]